MICFPLGPYQRYRKPHTAARLHFEEVFSLDVPVFCSPSSGRVINLLRMCWHLRLATNCERKHTHTQNINAMTHKKLQREVLTSKNMIIPVTLGKSLLGQRLCFKHSNYARLHISFPIENFKYGNPIHTVSQIILHVAQHVHVIF